MSLTPGVGSGPFCAVEGLAQIAGALAACDELSVERVVHLSGDHLPFCRGRGSDTSVFSSSWHPRSRECPHRVGGLRPFPCCKRLQFNDSAIFLEIARDDGGHALRVFAKSRLA